MEKLSENKYPLVQNHKKSNDRKPMNIATYLKNYVN